MCSIHVCAAPNIADMAAINALDHMATPQRDELHPHEDPRIDATVPCAASYERLRWPHSVVTYLPAFW
jgi:hypothetical protein